MPCIANAQVLCTGDINGEHDIAIVVDALYERSSAGDAAKGNEVALFSGKHFYFLVARHSV